MVPLQLAEVAGGKQQPLPAGFGGQVGASGVNTGGLQLGARWGGA